MRFQSYLNEIFTWEEEFDPKRDNAPQVIGDSIILYHGTSQANAALILSTKRIKGSPGYGSGFSTTIKDASSYGLMKAMETKDKSIVLRLEIDKDWFDKQEIMREIGGHSRNQFLITGDIPPDAVRSIRIVRRRTLYI